ELRHSGNVQQRRDSLIPKVEHTIQTESKSKHDPGVWRRCGVRIRRRKLAPPFRDSDTYISREVQRGLSGPIPTVLAVQPGEAEVKDVVTTTGIDVPECGPDP